MKPEGQPLPLSSASSLYPLNETHFPIGVRARSGHRPYSTPNTDLTKSYWRRLLTDTSQNLPEVDIILPMEQKTVASTIRLECGCFAAIITDHDGHVTEYIPKHIKGCTKKNS